MHRAHEQRRGWRIAWLGVLVGLFLAGCGYVREREVRDGKVVDTHSRVLFFSFPHNLGGEAWGENAQEQQELQQLRNDIRSVREHVAALTRQVQSLPFGPCLGPENAFQDQRAPSDSRGTTSRR